MMKIPVYENKIKQDQGKAISPSAYQPAQINLDANLSGSAYDTAAANLGNVVFDIAKKVGDHVAKMKEEDNHQAVLVADTNFQTEVNENLLYNTESKIIKDPKTGSEIQVSNGFLNRQGVAAEGSYPEFKKAIAPVKQKYLDAAENDWQRSKLEQMFTRCEGNAAEQVLRHQVTQRDSAAKQTVIANLDLAVADSPRFAGDPRKALDNFNFHDQKLSEWLVAKGNSPEQTQLAKQKFAYSYASTSLTAPGLSSGQMSGLVETFKDKLSKEDYSKLKLSVEGKGETENQFLTWQAIKDTPEVRDSNYSAVQSNVYSRTDLDTAKKEKLWNYLEAKMKERNSQESAFITAQDKQLVDDVANHAKNGGNLDSALQTYSTVKKPDGSIDNNLTIRRTKKIRDYYASIETKDNLEILKTIEDEAQVGAEGVVGRINAAYDRNELSSKTHSRLLDIVRKGQNPRHASIMAEVEALAVKGAGKKKSPLWYEFINDVKKEANYDPDKYVEIATRKREKVGTFFFRQSRFKQEREERMNQAPTPSSLPAPTQAPSPTSSYQPQISTPGQKDYSQIDAFLISRKNPISDKNRKRVEELIQQGIVTLPKK